LYKVYDIPTDYRSTCSAESLKDLSVTFVRSEKFIDKIEDSIGSKRIYTFIPAHLMNYVHSKSKSFRDRLNPIWVRDVDKEFTIFHNWVNANKQPKQNIVASDCEIHETALVGADAMKYIYDPMMLSPIQLKHMGNVILGSKVKIFPYATIHRASLGSTCIGENCAIGAYCNVGHNVYISKNTILTPYVCIGGSARIGEGCFIGMGAIIRDGVVVCDRVKVGMGALVSKDITKPGVYIGSPARRKGDWDGSWHS
jgi:acetyltransferase-like isoleucine patch superfamily enzyme